MRISPALRISISHQRYIHPTPARFKVQNDKDPSISQGHVTDPNQQHPQDPQSQAACEGIKKAHGSDDTTPLDAAARGGVKATEDPSVGNPEIVGFVEQVGSASATAADGSVQQDARKGEEEEARAPGTFESVKQALGMGTTAGDVKQNKGGTNPSTSRGFHTGRAQRG